MDAKDLVTPQKNARQINQDAPLCQKPHSRRMSQKKVTICANCRSHEHVAALSGCPVAVKYFNEIQTKNNIIKLEDLKRSPDLLNNVKIGQGRLQLIMGQIFVLPNTFWSRDLNNLMNNPSNSPVISE